MGHVTVSYANMRYIPLISTVYSVYRGRSGCRSESQTPRTRLEKKLRLTETDGLHTLVNVNLLPEPKRPESARIHKQGRQDGSRNSAINRRGNTGMSEILHLGPL